eukprot:6606252-Pyramimonas_sp.AAC.1
MSRTSSEVGPSPDAEGRCAEGSRVKLRIEPTSFAICPWNAFGRTGNLVSAMSVSAPDRPIFCGERSRRWRRRRRRGT